MARTAEAALLTERHRRLQVAVNASALRDLLQLWGIVSPLDLRGTVDPFAQAAALLVRARRRDSSVAASRYFRDFRRLEGVVGQALIVQAEPIDPAAVEGQLRGAALSGIVRARQRGFTPEAAARNGFVKAAGTATSLVLGGGRQTLLGAIRADGAAQGWQRVTDASPCAFCRMVASRGAVFKTDDGADFKAHGHCGCTVEPVYEGSKPLPANERFRQEWDEATQGLSGDEALNAYRRRLEGRE